MSKIRIPVIAGVAALASIAALAFFFGMTGAGPVAGAVTLPSNALAPTPPAEVPVSSTLFADPANDLTFATIDLHSGYIMDPYLLPVVGKGETAAGGVQKGCNGFVSTSPNVVVNWSGKGDMLSFFVYSDADAVLAVQQPDGSYVCNDDAGPRTTDPLVRFAKPVPGVYRVHVGTTKKDEPALGFLAVTQLDLNDEKLAQLDLSPMLHRRLRPQTQMLEQLNPAMLLTRQTPIFGSTDLKPGFDAVNVFAAGGGDISAVRVEDERLACAGFVSAVPSYRFTWTGPKLDLRAFFEAPKDSSLAVVTPDQAVLCNMNSAPGNLNPSVDIASAAKGDYEVYVAAMVPRTVVAGRLTVTGDLRAAPAVLAPQPAGQ